MKLKPINELVAIIEHSLQDNFSDKEYGGFTISKDDFIKLSACPEVDLSSYLNFLKDQLIGNDIALIELKEAIAFQWAENFTKYRYFPTDRINNFSYSENNNHSLQLNDRLQKEWAEEWYECTILNTYPDNMVCVEYDDNDFEIAHASSFETISQQTPILFTLNRREDGSYEYNDEFINKFYEAYDDNLACQHCGYNAHNACGTHENLCEVLDDHLENNKPLSDGLRDHLRFLVSRYIPECVPFV